MSKHKPKLYKSYPFRTQDPMVGRVLEAVNGRRFSAVSKSSGVATQTLGNWRSRRTLRPQFCTMAAVLGACGKEFTIKEKSK